MGRYFGAFCLLFTLLIFTACSKDSPDTMVPDTENENSGNNDDGTGGDDTLNDPQCDYDMEADYSISLQISDEETYYEYHMYLLDASGNIVEDSPVPNNGPATGWTISDSAGETFHLVLKKYVGSADAFEGYLFLEMPPGNYHYISEYYNYPDYETLSFSINSIGELPFTLLNTYNIPSNFYSTENGGTYFFGQDLTNYDEYYPEHGGYYLTMRASNEEVDRYYWSTDPPFVNPGGSLNFQNLPQTDTQLNVSFGTGIQNVSYLSISGFAPQNASSNFGNRMVTYYSSVENFSYSIPDNVFNRYRYEITYSLPGGIGGIGMARNSDTPVELIEGVNYSLSVNNANLQGFSANTEGDYDAIVLTYGEYENIPPTNYYFTVVAPNKGTDNVSYTIPSSLQNEIFSNYCFGCMDYYGATLRAYESKECYRSYLMTQFEQPDNYLLSNDSSLQYTNVSE